MVTYYFCSQGCKEQFDATPERYATQREPRITEAMGIPAPKFGSAGSGGAEYEPGPSKVKDKQKV